MQPKQCFKEDCVYQFKFSNVGTLITFLPSCFKNHINECLKFSCCNFKINMSKNGVKYLLGVSFCN